MNADIFLDTDILVYAYDRDAGEKHLQAAEWIESFWKEQALPWVSVQVLQEFYTNLVEKGIRPEESSQVIANYFHWRVIENSKRLLRQALGVQRKWKIPLPDAMIVAAAQQAQVSTLWSDDLHPGQNFDGVVVRNPFLNEC